MYRPGALRGISLLEIMVVLTLIAGALSLVGPSFSGLTGAYLRKSSSMLTGTIRDAYNRAVLSGETHRLVMNLEENTFWLEKTSGGAVLPRKLVVPEEIDEDMIANTVEGAQPLVRLDILSEELESLKDSDDEEDKEKLKLFTPPTWQKVEDEMGEPQKLEPDISFRHVWLEHYKGNVSDGLVAMLFSTDGYAEEAHIVIEDGPDEEDILVLVVQPLTGEVYVEEFQPEIPVL